MYIYFFFYLFNMRQTEYVNNCQYSLFRRYSELSQRKRRRLINRDWPSEVLSRLPLVME